MTPMPDTQEEPEEIKGLEEERTLEGIRIVKTGIGTYNAYSRTHPETAYAVNIFANNLLGECDCRGFRLVKYPRWKPVGKPYAIFMCAHLRAINNHVMLQFKAAVQERAMREFGDNLQ